MRFGVLVHDLVPVRYPEWCHHGVPRTFRAWYDDVLPYCDLVLANSQHTAHDVEAYARESAIRLPGPVQPVPIGTGFGVTAPHASTPRNPALPPPGSYVLFVATLEARKNHALAVRVWSLLVDEVNQGRRAPDTVPTLVFAGRFGWLIARSADPAREHALAVRARDSSSATQPTPICALCTRAASSRSSPRCTKAGACR